MPYGNHRFKKQFGQNFLSSSRFIGAMIDPLELVETDTVIEIGPGNGNVTEKLLETGAKVISIEVDYTLIPKLTQRFEKYISKSKFSLVNQDVLKIDLEEILKENNATNSIKVVGSLPYNISKKIIKKFIEFNYLSIDSINQDNEVKAMSFIIQEEVAKDIAAKAPSASFLGNYVQIFADVKKLESIPASQFFPKPKVNGGILFLNMKPRDQVPNSVRAIIKLIRAGFAQPRKTVLNNLGNLKELNINKVKIKEKLLELGLTETARPSELTLEHWKELATLN